MTRKVGLTIKISVLFLFMIVLALGNIVIIHQFIEGIKKDFHVINISGKQRMLSQKISKLVLSIANDNDNDRNPLKESIEAYDWAHYILVNGGIIQGREIPPASIEMKKIFQRDESIWVDFKKNALIVSVKEQESFAFKKAFEYISENNETLLAFSDSATSKFDAFFSKRVDFVRVSLLLLLICDIFIFIIGFILSLRIVRPIKELSNMASEVGKGDLSKKITNFPNDEIGVLGHSFNEMLHRLEDSHHKLLSSKSFTENILKSMIDSLIVLNGEGTMKQVNPATLTLLEYSEKELLGKSIDMILYKNKNLLRDNEGNVKYEGKGDVGSFKTKTGQLIPMNLHMSTMKNDEGKFIGYLCVARDVRQITNLIDELEKSNEELESRVFERTAEIQKLSTAIEQSPSVVIITNLNGTIEYVNQKFVETTGYSREEVLGENPSLLKSDNLSAEDWKGIWETLNSGKQWRGEVHNRKKNGDPYWVLVAMSPVTNTEGVITHYTSTQESIDDLKKVGEQLMISMEKAEGANKAKSDFLANMSHEIRTPMNAVIGMTHLALQTDLTDKQRGYLGKVELASHSLLGIINDILDFSKIEAGMMVIESIDFVLEDVFIKLANLITPLARKKNLELLFNISPEISSFLKGDPLRLEQTLINLVNNAIKFTQTGEIIVSVDIERESPQWVRLRFSVKDTGLGMTVQQKDRLFQPFTQADNSTTRKHGGTGLGLSISKHFIEMMDGKIWLESEIGKGSEFYFTARFGISNRKKKVEHNTSPEFQNIKVLLLNNHNTMRKLTLSYLNSFFDKVVALSTVDDFLKELKKSSTSSPYELLFLDCFKPGTNEIETLKYIQEHPDFTKESKMIVSSSLNRTEFEQVIEGITIDGFIEKPLLKSSFLETLFKSLGQRVGEGNYKKNYPESEFQRVSEIVEGAKVLLVEDNEINQELALEILQNLGLLVDVAENGKIAVEKIMIKDQKPYELVLMDIHMPIMDGYEATKEIRKQGHTHLPIIAMTADAMTQDIEQCMEAGMNAHLSKPIIIQELYTALCKWIIPTGKRITLRKNDSPMTKNNSSLPERLKGFNAVDAIIRLGGREELYQKILIKFRDNQHDIVEKIRKSLNRGDHKEALLLVHTLKGLSGSIGATGLTNVVTKLERAMKEEEPIASLIEALKDSVFQVIFIIDECFKEEFSLNTTTEESKEINNNEIKPLINELHDLLEQGNTKAKKISKEIELLMKDGPNRRKMEQVFKLASHYKYKEALIILKELKKIGEFE